MRTRSGTLAACGALLLATVLAGCSSSDDGDASSSGASASATAAVTPAAAGAEEFCKVLQKQTALAQQGTASQLEGDNLKKFIADAQGLNQELLAAAPESIKKDVQVSVDISEMAQEAALDPSKREAVLKKSQEQSVVDANQRLSSFAGEACSLTPETGASPGAS